MKENQEGFKMKKALKILSDELNFMRDKQFLCRQVRERSEDYDEQIDLLLKAIEYLEMAIKKGELNDTTKR